jgi:hypothetical protein
VSASRPLVWRKALRNDGAIDRTALLVAHTLSTYLNGRGVANPSRETLAAGSRLSADTVDRAVRRLEQAGYLEVERTRGGGYGDNRHTNTYRVWLPATAPWARLEEWPDDESHGRTGAAVAGGVTAAKTASHGRKQAESQPHGCGPKTMKTSKTAAPGAAAAFEGAAADAETENPTEAKRELFRAVDVLRSAAAQNLPVDNCTECGERRPLLNGLACIPCAARIVAADIADDLRSELERARADPSQDGRR